MREPTDEETIRFLKELSNLFELAEECSAADLFMASLGLTIPAVAYGLTALSPRDRESVVQRARTYLGSGSVVPEVAATSPAQREIATRCLRMLGAMPSIST